MNQEIHIFGKAILILILLCMNPLVVFGQSHPYEKFMEEIEEMERAGDYQGALKYLQTHEGSFPCNWFALSKEQVYLNEKLMRYGENLEIYSEGHKKGFFYLLHPAIPRYAPYLDLEGFDELIEADQKLRERALGLSCTRYRVYLPPVLEPDQDYPLFLIFHGGNSNFDRVEEHWKEITLDTMFIKVYLQSYRHYDSESYGWSSGDERADKEVRDIYEEIKRSYPVDTSIIIAAGISAGATSAIDQAFRKVLPLKGCLLFCPGFPGSLGEEDPVRYEQAGFKTYLVGGEHDYYREYQERLTGIFDQIGLEYSYQVVRGMSHQYPDNEAMYIRQGIQFLIRN